MKYYFCEGPFLLKLTEISTVVLNAWELCYLAMWLWVGLVGFCVRVALVLVKLKYCGYF